MRPPVTVVIPVWNGWEVTAGCLASLRPTLSPSDDVVVVDNGSEDATAAMLRANPWVTVITNPTNLGFARACNQGAAAAAGELIVFLNNDTVLAPGWLDRLAAPFRDPGVVGAGPRSNFVSGPQMVHATAYDVADAAAYRAWADAWAAEHEAQVEVVHRLVGFCLAVRRAAFAAIGGFDEAFEIGSYEDDDLCCRLVEHGGQLVIAHDAFVHHIGHRTFDVNGLDWRAIESANGVRFLQKRQAAAATLAAAVDGSTCPEGRLPACTARLGELFDEVVVYHAPVGASGLGATVVREPGDVAGVTTAAWTLWTSPDEEVTGDLDTLRAILAHRPLPDSVCLPVRELHGGGTTWREGLTHYTPRVTRSGGPPPSTCGPGCAALCEVMLVRTDGPLCTPSTDAERALEQAATVVVLGWPDFALPYLELAADDPVVRRGAWWHDVATGIVLAGAASAAEVLARLAPEDQLLCGMARARAGDPRGALALLSGCHGPVAAVERWRALDQAGDAPAARAALAAVGDGPALLSAVDHGCRDDPAVAARLLEVLWAAYPGSHAVLAGGSRLGLTAGLEAALEWAHRLRAHGLPAACPLLLGAADVAVPPLERVRAAAVAWAAFAEGTARQLLERAWPELRETDATAAQAFVLAVAPALLSGGAPVHAGQPS
ncbi:MAG TPA: glycosyltransferase family 2 protein [Acidimicrobiales bacterium]|nr:glycosyltransferase family 2 protein [Acidimicrobiales bacterium]